MPIKLIVERQTLCFNSEVIEIGRDPENQIALRDDLRLAPRHAVLRCVNGRWIVESRDGGLISVGSGRPTQFAWLNPGDVIHLTASGPELVFEPISDSTLNSPPRSRGTPPPSKASAPGRDGFRSAVLQEASPAVQRAVTFPAEASATTPPIPRIPAIHENESVPDLKTKKSDVTTTPDSVATTSNLTIWLGFMVSGAISLLLFVGLGLVIWPQQSPSNDSSISESAAPIVLVPTSVSPRAPSPTLDPREFLVLIGVGELTTDNRPHVLGVGWLWDDQTAVASRDVGEAIREIVAESRIKRSPRQGCVIQGIAVEVGRIRFPDTCQDISILELKEPMGLRAPARQQWRRANSKYIERRRAIGESLAYVSYRQLPRSGLIKGTHRFPLTEYDPETCPLSTTEARFVFEQGKHFLKSNELNSILEYGGILVDGERRILGMTAPDSSLIWTEVLERAIDSRLP